MQAIVTKYIGPTNFRGTRIKATCAAKTRLIGWRYDLGVEENHRNAATMLQNELDWTGPRYGKLHGGTMKNGDYCWVMVPRDTSDDIPLGDGATLRRI